MMPAAFVQLDGSTGSAGPTPASGELDLTSIFSLCALLYGAIAIMWVVFHRKQEGTVAHTSMILITYAAMSLGMNVLNKSLVTALSAPCLITGIQMLATVGSLVALQWRKISEIQMKHRVWLVVPLLFTAMLTSSLYTYQYMNLSMFTIVRNLAPMVCLPIEIAVMPANQQPTVTRGMIAALAVMLLGAIAYGFDTASITAIGITCAALNMVFGISDRLVQRRLLVEECKDLPTEACAFLNNFVGLLPSLVAAGLLGEMTVATGPAAANWTDPKVLSLLLLSCAIGLGISYFGLATQRAISATSVMVLQNLVKVAVIMMGVTYFGDSISSWTAATGICLSLGGSMWYSKIMMDLRDVPKESKPLVEEGKKSNV